MDKISLWKRFKEHHYVNREIGLMLDISRMNFSDDFFDKMAPNIQRAIKEMESLESGAISNPDENRMVGHYWLRNAKLAPTAELTKEIDSTVEMIKDFSTKVHTGKILSQGGKSFNKILIIGIGGSALGPQLASTAAGMPDDKMTPYFFDNTDPDGMDYILNVIGNGLSETLSIVISKSGGTVETRNGMLEARRAYEKKGLDFSKHAVAVTSKGSKLYDIADSEGWISIFPMWDWVGGRTSETSAVGMLPAALQGLDIDSLLNGARLCDEATREKDVKKNPSAILALMWYYATNGRGDKDMVILPYKDRLALFSKYLQQLIMESLGKELDSDGRVVNQGISVYGNKGTTDQHAYIQQLRDGVNNFFVTFIEVLKDREGESMEVEPGITTGDYLSAFMLGTRSALYGNGRESMTIAIDKIDAFSLGVLIALYERTVGLYASLVNINAYHQPGVEAGKKAATAYIKLQTAALDHLKNSKGNSLSAEEIASAINASDEAETIFKILLHISRNSDHGITIIENKTSFFDSKFEYNN